MASVREAAMDDGVKIDKSLARGAFRTELRNNPELLSDPGNLFSEDLHTRLMSACLERARRGMDFSPQSFRAIARAVQRAPLTHGETIYSLTANVVLGSAKKSYFEAAARARPAADPEVLACVDAYVHVRKDRMVGVERQFPVVLNVHAVKRYIQRGAGVRLNDGNTAGMIDETCRRAGLVILLSHLAGRMEGANFAVPFREGLLLYEARHSTLPDVWRLDSRGAYTASSMLRSHALPHRMHFFGDGLPAVYEAKTFVGRAEMKPGQSSWHDLAEGVYQRHRKDIDLLGSLAGWFYPGHDRASEQKLEEALPRLDQVVRDLAAALSFDRRLSYAFVREDSFGQSRPALPSQSLGDAEFWKLWHLKGMETSGLAGLRGAAFHYAREAGLEGFPGARFVPTGMQVTADMGEDGLRYSMSF